MYQFIAQYLGEDKAVYEVHGEIVGNNCVRGKYRLLSCRVFEGTKFKHFTSTEMRGDCIGRFPLATHMVINLGEI